MTKTTRTKEFISDKAYEKIQVPKKIRSKVKLLEKYDLSFLTNNFVDRGTRFSPEQIWPLKAHFGKADIRLARRLEREFKRFVALTLIQPGNIFAPSGPVDMYWHFFVLHTRHYKEFCEKLWGSFADHPRGFGTHYPHDSDIETFIEHVPAVDETRPMMRDAYERTRKLYIEVFGKADPHMWGEAGATCGDSYSGVIPGGRKQLKENDRVF